MNIVLAGAIGLTGLSELVSRQPELWEGFPARFRRHSEQRFAELAGRQLPKPPEGAVSLEAGLYRALWLLGEEKGTGLVADYGRLPLEQAIIELSQRAGRDPLTLAGRGYVALEEGAPREGETLIGFTLPYAARILRQKENDRYLTPSEEKQ